MKKFKVLLQRETISIAEILALINDIAADYHEAGHFAQAETVGYVARAVMILRSRRTTSRSFVSRRSSMPTHNGEPATTPRPLKISGHKIYIVMEAITTSPGHPGKIHAWGPFPTREAGENWITSRFGERPAGPVLVSELFDCEE